MVEADLVHSELTREIIGGAMEVHRHLGCGFLESVYEESLAIELDLRNLIFQRQKALDIYYKGKQAKQFVCDLIVENKVIVELKATKGLGYIDEAQLINYLKASGIKVGLLMNFGENSFKFKRLVY
jgi:GxxExxY protein